MGLLIQLAVNTLAVLTASYVLGGIRVEGVVSAIVVAVVLGIVNTFVRPILIIFTFPITVLTLGLFLLAVNALMVMLVAKLVNGFSVDNFWWALAFSLVVSFVGSFLSAFLY